MSKKASVAILAMLSIIAVGIQAVEVADANPEGTIPQLSMPKEYINYTITDVNGTFWAKIDGDYPIYLLKSGNCGFSGDLPMVYPMPPQTTNITVSLDGKELAWSNYTQTDPLATHHTAIGDWWMIYSNLANVSGYFELKIHYEHPLERVNDSYLFLYDLNISPYLSEQSNSSTAYFTVQMPTDIANLKVYSTETDTKWNPETFNLTQTNSMQVALIQMHSEFGTPLLGDLVAEFSYKQVDEFPFLGAFVLFLATALAVMLTLKLKKKARQESLT